MSKVYRNKTGILTISGKVKDISADRTSVTITSATYNSGERKWNDVEYTATTPVPAGAEIVKGADVMVVGYQSGPNKVTANALFAGKGYHEEADLGFLAGKVVKAVLNEEKNQDGTPKTKQDGTARKRHFDVFVMTVSEEGEEQLHIMKVYDGSPKFINPGEKTQLEKTMARFKPFMEENKEATVFVCTSPADSYSYESTDKDGNTVVRTNYSHMGYKSLDIAFGEVRENNRTQEAPKEAPTQAPVATAETEQLPFETPAQPTPQPQPVQTPVAPATDMNVPESLSDVDFTMG